MTFTSVASLGMLLGAYLNPLIEVKQLEKEFGYFAIAVAILMLSRQFTG
ncbi:hypothetical protein [Oscillatoria sp. FACHB-1406]|nr:hypothetical protein [Oscillatoria sp. FACHB-1406]MBD2578465.1 hypothetical protein [Oscillatoria sp. FACHB-1406]